MTNLPETVQWVLDFLNINKTPGIFYPQTFPAKHKRLPLPQKQDLPNLVIENDCIINRSTGDKWIIRNKKLEKTTNTFALKRELEEINTRLKELLGKDFDEEIVNKGGKGQNELDAVKKLVSSKDMEKKIQYWGNTAVLGLENYKDFFLKNGIPPFKGKELLLENHEPLSTLDTESFAKRPKRNDEPGFYEYYQDNPPIEFMFSKKVENVCCELSSNLRDLVWCPVNN